MIYLVTVIKVGTTGKVSHQIILGMFYKLLQQELDSLPSWEGSFKNKRRYIELTFIIII